MQTNLKRELKKIIQGRIKFDEFLSKHTTFRIGGPAWAWVEVRDEDDLKNLIVFCRQKSIPLFIIGRGSNILVKDKGIEGIAAVLNAESFRSIDFDWQYLIAGSGLRISELVHLTKMLQLGGCEFLSGIPASLGGAVAMNAGVRDALDGGQYNFLTIGQLIEEVEAMDYQGNTKKFLKRELKFGYRNSNLFDYIILKCRIRLEYKFRKDIENDIERFLTRKRLTQELEFPNPGCVFKNPKDSFISAGKLIESSGFKGRRIGDAQVSERHANFIINRGRAKAEEVLRLMDLIIKNVKKDHGITLEPEIKIIGK